MNSAKRMVFFDLDHSALSLDAQDLLHTAIDHHRSQGDFLVAITRLTQPIPLGMDLAISHHLADSARPPCICPSKAKTLAVVEAILGSGADPSQCFVYSEPCSGGGLLTIVGNPRVLPCCPTGVEEARRMGWRCISAITEGVAGGGGLAELT